MRQRADVQRKVQRLVTDLQRALVAVPGAFESDRSELKSYPIADLRKGVSDADLGDWLRDMLLVATSLENLGLVELKIDGDQLILKQPPWVHAVVVKHLATLRERANREPMRQLTQEDFTLVKNGLHAEALRQIVRKRLAKLISVEFLDLATDEALIYLQESVGVGLWIGHAEVRKRGIKLDTPVTLKLANAPFADLLDKVLLPVGLDWHLVEPGLIVIRPPLEGGAATEPRAYGIQELLDGGQTVEGLVSLITNLDPGSWAATGGPGSIHALSPGLLIVNHTRSVHDRIDKLLDKLTSAR